jgi:regulation of enolase protein 1 (concanavalin A-like superfamily)
MNVTHIFYVYYKTVFQFGDFTSSVRKKEYNISIFSQKGHLIAIHFMHWIKSQNHLD